MSSSTTGTVTSVASLPPAYTHTTHTPSASGYSNAFDDFFGSSSMPATRESRHDRRSSADTLPPAYPHPAESLPAYTPRGEGEPATLAMYLFKFGFLFPPFWILGMIILLSPLSPPEPSSDSETPGWLAEKSDEERQFVVSEMRRVEVKWAKRCCWAFSVFAILAVAAGLAVWSLLRIRL